MSADIKDYFLATPMKECEYMKVQYKHIPIDIREHYNLNEKVTSDNCIYIRIKKGMYGLKQAAVLAYNQLKARLLPKGYSPVEGTVGLWEHTTRKTKFCLCVDDFGIKSDSETDRQHLLQALKNHYTVTTDSKGKHYCGLSIYWNYLKEYVDISMPGYIKKVLQKYQRLHPSKPVNTPHPYNVPVYGQKTQYAKPEDTSPLLDKKGTRYIQGIVGSLLYYSRATDSAILTALNELSSQQAKPTENTKIAAHQLLDYVATHPDAIIRFHASDMILHIDSDAAYLVMPGAKSRISGYFQLGNHDGCYSFPNGVNGAILVECKTLRNVVASAAEAETGGVFHNAQIGIIIRVALTELGHPQPPTPLKTDNTTTANFTNSTLRQKRSKSWDMRYNWLRDRQAQEQFRIYWDKGIYSEADFTTKHYGPGHHLNQRQRYMRKMHMARQLMVNLLTQSHHSRREGVFLPSGLSADRGHP